MKPGLYALASFDGAPLAREDKAALGFVETATSSWHTLPGVAVCAVDDTPARDASSIVRTADSLTAFLGYLDEQDDLAAQLGLSRDTAPATLAWAAIEHLGADAPAAMLGEWSFLRWDTRARELIVLGSEAFRDPLFYATDGKRLALAPDLLQLTRLPWVGRTLDPEGFALRLSRAGLRRIMGRKTVWKGISSALPAVQEVFSLDRQAEVVPAPQVEPELWRGSFEDAVDALNAVGRRIVGQQMRRYGRSAFMLSGGLDSTLITALGAQERGSSAAMFCVSSVAPDGSGLADERQFSLAVAKSFGVPLELVSPALDANIYWPTAATFEQAGGPITGPRHYLYDVLFRASQAGGANAVFDGLLGELSITPKPKFGAAVSWPRHVLYSMRAWQQKRRTGKDWLTEAFHVQFSKEFLAGLPREWESVWREGPKRSPRRGSGDPAGFDPAIKKVAGVGSSIAPGLRHVMPFRDQRLLRLAASLPNGFSKHAGETRALGRAMLRGHVPDFVRTRTSGMPISPDFQRRMQSQAAAALARIGVYREIGLEKWLDLDLLSASLGRIEQGHSTSSHAESQAQMTCLAGEFLSWNMSYLKVKTG